MKTLLVVLGLLILLAPLQPLIAQTQTTNSDVTNQPQLKGLTDSLNVLPGQTFYFLKTTKEKIEYFTTFGAKNKAKIALRFAQERLKEYQALKQQGKDELALRAFDMYLTELNLAINNLEEVRKENRSLDQDGQILLLKLQQQLTFLTALYKNNVPAAVEEKFSAAFSANQRAYQVLKILIAGEQKEALQDKAKSAGKKADSWTKKIFNTLWP
ncbi:MAG: DUF5667 domain-containing protein [Patescibacteria group bacterium]|nr:DUF5667 domain-containing protein [Patescibacteria group bacterium]MDD5121094.1 DUF5667 domain-containing protein [Patescibacteria group bacterium]MDD5395987.1 DUF5667 domain-containing protein [Patescibacteria group bacterium]